MAVQNLKKKYFKAMKLYWKDQGLNHWPDCYIISYKVKVGELFEHIGDTSGVTPML